MIVRQVISVWILDVVIHAMQIVQNVQVRLAILVRRVNQARISGLDMVALLETVHQTSRLLIMFVHQNLVHYSALSLAKY